MNKSPLSFDPGIPLRLESVPPPLLALFRRHQAYLKSTQDPRGFIPDHGRELDAVQYGTSFFALASFLLDEEGAESAWNYFGEASLSGPALPDNIFVAQFFILALGPDQAETRFPGIVARVRGSTSNTSFGSTQSNNYFTMEMLRAYLQALLFGDEGERTACQSEMRERGLSFLEADGISYDWPRRPQPTDAKNFSLAYHSRYLFVLALYCFFSNDRVTWSALEKGFQTLANFIPTDGENAYYGRSLNSLYGTANALSAFILYRKLAGSNRFQSTEKKLERYLLNAFVSSAGLLRVLPNAGEAQRCGYDEYIFDSVYQSYALGAILLAYALPETRTPLTDLPLAVAPAKSIRTLASAGLTFVRVGATELAFSQKGSDQSGLAVMGGLKYAAFTPLFFKVAGCDKLPSLPQISRVGRVAYYFRDIAQVSNPVLAGFLPFFRHGRRFLYPGKLLHSIVEEEADRVRILLEIEGMEIAERNSLHFFWQHIRHRIFRAGTLRSVFSPRPESVFRLELTVTEGGLTGSWSLPAAEAEWTAYFGIRFSKPTSAWRPIPGGHGVDDPGVSASVIGDLWPDRSTPLGSSRGGLIYTRFKFAELAREVRFEIR